VDWSAFEEIDHPGWLFWPRRTSPQTLMRTFLAPVTMSLGAGVAVFAMGLRQWYVWTALWLAAFGLGTVIVEFRRGVQARRHLVHETQAGEGWRLVKTAYDDGGFSGATMERPALKALLADVKEKRRRLRSRAVRSNVPSQYTSASGSNRDSTWCR